MVEAGFYARVEWAWELPTESFTASRPGRKEERYQTSGYRAYALYLKEMASITGSQEGWHRGIASCPFTDRRLFVCLKLTGEEENERKNNQTLAHWGHEYFVTARHFEFNRQ
jgi:hypothetical protein